MKKQVVHKEYYSDYETIYKYIENGIFSWYSISNNNSSKNKELVYDCEFNGGVFEIKRGSTVDSCFADWNASMKGNQKKYEQSEEYAKIQEKRKLETSKLNSEVVALLKAFVELPFEYMDSVSMCKILNWLCSYQPYSDCILCTESNDAFVVSTLESFGFKSNANINLPTYTMEESFLYIVGQAISTMKVVALHHMVCSYVESWKKKYL